MYIRFVPSPAGGHYFLRTSYRDSEFWKFRDLMDLGANPSEFVQYPGGNGFYFDPRLEESLEAQGVVYSSDELEEVFFPFLRPAIRRVIETFRNTRRHRVFSEEEIRRYRSELHTFDERRLHFLKFGRMDMGNLDGRPLKFLKVLFCKSRDEIEATIESMEKELPPREIASYVYTAFHLQTYFSNHLLRHNPAALEREKIDSLFLQEICRLNADPAFFRGVERSGSQALHLYLQKYVFLYFDHDFMPDTSWHERLIEMMRKRHHQFSINGPLRPSMSIPEAYRVLEISKERFERMGVETLNRVYRRRAKRMHPDSGGDHEAFVRLTQAYELLLSLKR